MPHSMTFRGAYIRYCDLRFAEAGVFCRVHFTAELTDPVIKAMDWSDVPSCVDSAKLDGILSAQKMTLDPNQKQLKDHRIEMDVSEVTDFQIARVKENDSTRTELRFIAKVAEPGAVQWIEDYLRTVGQDPGALKVSYVKQEDLPLEDADPRATKDQQAATSEQAD